VDAGGVGAGQDSGEVAGGVHVEMGVGVGEHWRSGGGGPPSPYIRF
jgi:hypothetical protein